MILALAGACSSGSELSQGWSEESHGNDAAPDYALVFPSDEILSLSLVLTSEVAQDMEDDLRIALAGDTEPSWFSASVRHDGREWQHVGIRYRGNGTLSDIQDEGSIKLPFKLSFDKFEDEYPDTKNQRFYGFKRLNFSTTAKDDSLIREVLASEMFRAAGVPNAQAAFASLSLDTGEGEVFHGVFSLLEDADDDALQDSQLGGADGALFKAEGSGAELSEFISTSFTNKTSEEDGIAPIKTLVELLNNEALDEAEFSAQLEEQIDVSSFLLFLAANTAMGNHETYGCEAENYFLYASPSQSDRLLFFPVDLDRAWSQKQGRCGEGEIEPVDLIWNTSDTEWPLISRLLSVDSYREEYYAALEELLDDVLSAEAVEERATALHRLIESEVLSEPEELQNHESQEAFLNAVSGEEGLASAQETREQLIRQALELRD